LRRRAGLGLGGCNSRLRLDGMGGGGRVGGSVGALAQIERGDKLGVLEALLLRLAVLPKDG
jgi:hypothetical protein